MSKINTTFSTWESKFILSLNEMKEFLDAQPDQTKVEVTLKGTKHSTKVILLYFKDRDVVLGKSFSINKCPIYVGNNIVKNRLIQHIADRGLETTVSMIRWSTILGMSPSGTIRCFKEIKNQ